MDCLDEIDDWRNGEIVAIQAEKVKVHFTGFSSNYDLWIEKGSERLLKQWTHGKELKLNNRIDVLDSVPEASKSKRKPKWGKARVIAKANRGGKEEVLVHF